MATMFNNCYSLQTVPLFNTAAVTTMVNMFQSIPPFSCIAVIPAFNCTAVTASSNYPFSNCPSLSASNVTNVKLTHSYAGDKLSASAINTIFTNLPTVTGQTITILGNPGGGTCTTSIATAKGWTVA